MNSIDTSIAIGGMATRVGARSQSESHPGKVLIRDSDIKPSPDHAQFDPVQIEASFSTYGSRNERIAVIIKNGDTGEVIRDFPSKAMQKLHVHLDVLA
jgi:hypothetical protein